jgi:hypothetical protein
MMGDTRNFCWQDPNIFLKPFNTTAFLTIVNKDAVKNKKPTFSSHIDLQKIELGAFCFRVCVCVCAEALMLWRIAFEFLLHMHGCF